MHSAINPKNHGFREDPKMGGFWWFHGFMHKNTQKTTHFGVFPKTMVFRVYSRMH